MITIELVGGPRCGERLNMTGPEYPPDVKHTLIQQFKPITGAELVVEKATVFTYIRTDQMAADDSRIVRRYEFVGYRDGVSTPA